MLFIQYSRTFSDKAAPNWPKCNILFASVTPLQKAVKNLDFSMASSSGSKINKKTLDTKKYFMMMSA